MPIVNHIIILQYRIRLLSPASANPVAFLIYSVCNAAGVREVVAHRAATSQICTSRD
ncbi:MAG: hypothetical protein HC835_08845 [Oscillatoriales cyanobacterium RM2_1_1]|nr:hypothetical protein [Oscillatoriales cyanobacterium RM2_1_1]